MSAAENARGSLLLRGLTPLLDTLFLLLFALLAVADLRQDRQEVRIELPEVAASPNPEETSLRRLTIVIDADRRISIAGSDAILSAADWDAAVRQQLRGALPEEVVVEIRADREAPHGAAVELLQYLRLQGFSQVELLATGGGSSLFPEDS